MSAVEGVAVCDERAEECRCVKPIGHVEGGDPVHACDPKRCTGQWKGNLNGADFRIVAFPTAVGEPRRWDFA